jgi:hypothetical protein
MDQRITSDTDPKGQVWLLGLLKREITVVLSEDNRQALLASLSKTVAETIGKPQQYIMVGTS